MTVQITDYTPGGKPLSECLNPELLDTIQSIHGHGMLRMHASDRMIGHVQDEIVSRGYGLYVCERDVTPWEKEVGVDYIMGKGGDPIRDEDWHECISCHDSDHDIFEVFPVLGSLTESAKLGISNRMAELRAEAMAKQAAWEAEQAKNPPKQTYMITGCCIIDQSIERFERKIHL